MKRLLLVLLATLVVAPLTAPSASAAFPGANGVIAYTAYLGSQADICAVDPDGSNARVLVGGPNEQAGPAWSADGSKLAYEEFGHETAPHIKVLDLKTGTTTDLGEGFQPAWSPTGDRIAFVAGGLWIMDADGTDRRQIDPDDAGAPAWSPDGTKIIFYDDIRDGVADDGGIWETTPDGQQPVRLSEGGPASWSPDGTRLVADGGYWQMAISVMDADGTDSEIVLQSSGPRESMQGSTWSPDGNLIAFSRSRTLRYRTATDIWTMTPDGGSPQVLASTPNPEFDPDWQPVTSATAQVPVGQPCAYELHERTVSLNLSRHLVAKGKVTSVDGHAACAGGWVEISRRKNGRWKAVKEDITDPTGRYEIELPDRKGRYRASVSADTECDLVHSSVRKHSH